MSDWNAFRKQQKGDAKYIKQLSSMYEQSKSMSGSGKYVFYKDKPKKKSLRSKKEDLPAYIESLPDELRLQVLSELPIKDVLHSCQVSKKWEQICKDNYLWKALLVRDYGKFDDIQKTKFKTYVYHDKYYKLWVWLKQYKKYKQIKFKDVSKLEELDLSTNKLTSVPKELGNLSKLEALELIGNKLTSVPKELGNLSKLKYLRIYRNKLASLPKELGNLSKLIILDLSINLLTSVPKELGNLSQLEILDLGFNKFTPTQKEKLRKTFNYVSDFKI